MKSIIIIHVIKHSYIYAYCKKKKNSLIYIINFFCVHQCNLSQSFKVSYLCVMFSVST